VKTYRVLLSVLLVGLLSGMSVAAHAASGAIKVKSIAQVEIAGVGEDGKPKIIRAPADKATPGTKVFFVNTFENVSNKPAGGIVMTNPLPTHTDYQAGSAYGENTVITFSIDGGKNFAAAEELKVKSVDGDVTAKPSAYTHVRWVYKGQLAAGATAEVGFSSVIK
jgi:uncharacterized repeat protein (TIGR01451 family)